MEIDSMTQTEATNPTSTTLFKSLIAVKTRNPIIFGFHPSAQKCSAEAARIVYEAAWANIRKNYGTPAGTFSSWINFISFSTEASPSS